MARRDGSSTLRDGSSTLFDNVVSKYTDVGKIK